MSESERRAEVSMMLEWRLRRWARENYVPPHERGQVDWHPVVWDEFVRIDAERERAGQPHGRAVAEPERTSTRAGFPRTQSHSVQTAMSGAEADADATSEVQVKPSAESAHRAAGPLRHYVRKRPRVLRLLAGTLRCDRPDNGLAGPHFALRSRGRKAVSDLRRRVRGTGRR